MTKRKIKMTNLIKNPCSFRVIEFYDIKTDSVKVRFDVKIGNKQTFDGNEEGLLSELSVTKQGEPMKSDDPLIEPMGLLHAWARKFEQKDLALALRRLVEALES